MVVNEINNKIIPELRSLMGEKSFYKNADLLLLDINELVGQRIRLKNILSFILKNSFLAKLCFLGSPIMVHKNKQYKIKSLEVGLSSVDFEKQTKQISTAFIATMESHYKSLIPLIEKMHESGKEVVIILPYSSKKWRIKNQIPDYAEKIYIKDFVLQKDLDEMKKDEQDYLEWFLQNKDVYKDADKDAKNKHQLKNIFKFQKINYWPLVASGLKTYFGKVLPRQILDLKVAERILEKYQIKYLIGARIRKSSDIAFFAVAKNNPNIKTTTVLHGLITDNLTNYFTDGRYDLQDNVCVWTEDQKQMVLKKGAQQSAVKIIGNPQWDKMAELQQLDCNVEFGKLFIQNKYNKIITFCDQPSNQPEIRTELVQAAKLAPKTALIIKVHPVLKKEDIIAQLGDLPENVFILDDTDHLLYNGILCSDLMITVNSTVFIESLLLGTPIKLYKRRHKGMIEQWEKIGAPVIESKEVLQKVFQEEKTKTDYNSECESFKQKYLGHIDPGNITNKILEIAL